MNPSKHESRAREIARHHSTMLGLTQQQEDHLYSNILCGLRAAEAEGMASRIVGPKELKQLITDMKESLEHAVIKADNRGFQRCSIPLIQKANKFLETYSDDIEPAVLVLPKEDKFKEFYDYEFRNSKKPNGVSQETWDKCSNENLIFFKIGCRAFREEIRRLNPSLKVSVGEEEDEDEHECDQSCELGSCDL